MQALSDLRALRCSTFQLYEKKIRRQHGARPGTGFTPLSRLEPRAGSTLRLAVPQKNGFGLQHRGRRLWRGVPASEDDTTLTLETVESVEEVATPEPLPVEGLEGSEPTAKVKFVLQKECFFGQQYNVVGDNSYLGNWEPASAVPLVWSEGHVWSAEVEVPAGRQVQYKFLLTGRRGELEWQPGPNKSFEASGDERTLVISETWDTEDVVRRRAAGVETGEEVRSGEDVGSGDDADGEVKEEAVANAVAETNAGVEPSVEATSGEGSGELPEGTAAEVPIVDFAVAQAAAEVSEDV